jgi:hypothetical protein
MAIKTYHFTFEGTGGNGQTWTTTGYIQCEFVEVFLHAQMETFQQLTKGEAIYGKPGLGCNGPYDVTRAVIRQAKLN